MTRVVLFENFVEYSVQQYVIGREFRTQYNLNYLRPVPSSVLSEFC